MCSSGYTCSCCSAIPVLECHWESWAMLLCGFHAIQYIKAENPPKLVFILGDSNEKFSVN